MAQASEAYHAQMRSVINQSAHDGVTAYLTDHAINERAIIAKYQLGYVDDPLPGDEMYRGRIAIPYLSPTGVVSIKFRATGISGAKYLYHKGQRPRLYNTFAARPDSHVIGLCEGEVDAIVATEKLDIPTMGIPGVDTWMEQVESWKPIFKDFRTVLMFIDGDSAGANLGDAIAESLGTRVRIIPCDSGEDVASMVASGKADTLCQLARA